MNQPHPKLVVQRDLMMTQSIPTILSKIPWDDMPPAMMTLAYDDETALTIFPPKATDLTTWKVFSVLDKEDPVGYVFYQPGRYQPDDQKFVPLWEPGEPVIVMVLCEKHGQMWLYWRGPEDLTWEHQPMLADDGFLAVTNTWG